MLAALTAGSPTAECAGFRYYDIADADEVRMPYHNKGMRSSCRITRITGNLEIPGVQELWLGHDGIANSVVLGYFL